MTPLLSSRTLLLLLVLSKFTATTTSSSSSSSTSSSSSASSALASASSSTSSYSSIQALDKYGNSIQLSHARQAAQQHGTLVIAGVANEGNIVCISLSLPPKVGTLSSPGPQRMMHPISTSGGTTTASMICTGIKADARWLLHAMREYQARTWERYDTAATPKRVALAVAQVLLDFMGYARNQEFLDGVGPVLAERSWARPLGVQTLVVAHQAPLTLLDPSGVMEEYSAHAMGRDSQVCLDELELLYTPNMTTEELQELLVDIVQRRVIFENPNMYEKAELWIETLTERGVERSTRMATTKK